LNIKKKITNIMTFDLEEWFHILDLPEPIGKSDWCSLPSHIEEGLDLFLELLDRYNITCTFFVLGWIADKYPDLVRKINALNHEVASHGYRHELIRDIGADRFRNDIRRSKKLIEDIAGKKVKGYRGPGFSITLKNLWALEIIAEEGFEYDASLYPGVHGHGGIPGLPVKPFVLNMNNSNRIEEYPVTLINIGKYRIAFAGGGYFRLFPSFFISKCFRWLNRKGIPVLSYFHARDLDPTIPKLSMPLVRKFKCYVNVSRSKKKLENLLKNTSFCSIEEWRSLGHDQMPIIHLNDLLRIN
jgi:polysaccharide deacetylase family protein (PEP-CTERM system associated)